MTNIFSGGMSILWVVIALIVILALVYIKLKNNIVRAWNKCENAWQTIEAQLQRRNDLIPNLVETVKGYAKHESGTLEQVVAARNAVMAAPTPEAKMEASNQLTSTLRSLFALAEAYPELKADANFRQLQSDLTDTENRISYARMSYNDVVMDYNNAIQTFPGSLVAGSYKPRKGFEVLNAEAREAPKVNF